MLSKLWVIIEMIIIVSVPIELYFGTIYGNQPLVIASFWCSVLLGILAVLNFIRLTMLNGQYKTVLKNLFTSTDDLNKKFVIISFLKLGCCSMFVFLMTYCLITGASIVSTIIIADILFVLSIGINLLCDIKMDC
jgi:hypothetical protein